MRTVTEPHPAVREYRNQAVRLADLTVTQDVLEHLRFENCMIIGPAILGLLDNLTMIDCGFDAPGPEAVLWKVDRDRGPVVGVIAVRDCAFYSCTFQRVGFAVGEDGYTHIYNLMVSQP